MKNLSILGVILLSSISFGKYECKQIFWNDMSKVDKLIYNKALKHNGGKHPVVMSCKKVVDKRK